MSSFIGAAVATLMARIWGFAAIVATDLVAFGGTALPGITMTWDGGDWVIFWIGGGGQSVTFTGCLGAGCVPANVALSGLFPLISQISAPSITNPAAIRLQGSPRPSCFIATPVRAGFR